MHDGLRQVLESDMAMWVRDRFPLLPDLACHRAHNAVRSLYRAGGIATLEDMKYREGARGNRLPATFLLSHAMEEAVAALVESARRAGYGKPTGSASA